ncbi:hypothetical protein ACOTVS_11155 [Aliarcobacter butzleri]|uniref:hypothetical protein n=1 Tax=Aliarcobacter butzleri TaxID=28197 RepID=UPI00344E8877
MKKKLLLVSLITSFLFAQETDLSKIKNEIENLDGFKSFNTKILEIDNLKGVDGWYTAKGLQETNQGKRSFDFITNKEVVIFGSAYNLTSGEYLNVKFDFNKLKKSANYSVGNGKKEFFLVTDPECPFCQNLEEKLKLLKDKATIHVLLTADVIPSHFASRGMINYINSFPVEKRAVEANKVFLEKDRAKLLKVIDKYNIDMYKLLLEYKSNPNAREVVNMYLESIEEAFNVKLKSNDEIDRYLNEKIAFLEKTDLKKINAEYAATKDIIDTYFKVNGTPTVYDINGKKLENQFEMFAMLNAYDLEKIKEISSNEELVIKAGKKGAKKAFYFLSTQCPPCINYFNDKEKMNKLLSENEVYFLLGINGSNELKAEKELKYILSQPSNDLKFDALKSIMSGKQLNNDDLNKSYDVSFEKKIEKYIFRDLYQTFVVATPSIILEDGKTIK